jgi:methionyl-tRNA formyltransferase
MTDLPFGRGGSPLQNLLSRGIYNTQISAIRVVESVDAGPIYFKEPLSLEEGNANEIFERAAGIVFSKMIPRFLEQDLEPLPQEGEVVLFKRRKPEESEINFSSFSSFQKLYDFIRMLDGEGYPAAFLRLDNVKITFTKVQRADGKLLAHAEIVKEN